MVYVSARNLGDFYSSIQDARELRLYESNGGFMAPRLDSPPPLFFFFFYSSASTRLDSRRPRKHRVAWVRSFRWGRVDGWAKIDRMNRKPREYDDDEEEVTRRASSDTLAWIMTGTRRANFIGYLTFRRFVVVGSMRASATRLRPTCWNFGLSREIPAPAPNVFLDQRLGNERYRECWLFGGFNTMF